MKRPPIFPGIVFVLLGMNVLIVGVTVYAANMNGGAAIEPDYYRKALAHDEIRKQEREAAALGWTYLMTFERDAESQATMLRAAIRESSGAPIVGASIRAEAFPSRRATARVRLLCRETEPGIYTSPIDLNYSGQWNIELTIESRGHTVIHKTSIPALETK